MQRPRTPVHFPKMKVRGARNRRKKKVRLKSMTLLNSVVFSRLPDGGGYNGVVAPPGTPGVSSVQVMNYQDGWGRSVKPNDPLEEQAKARITRDPFAFNFKSTLSFTIEPGAADQIWETLMGEKRRSRS